MKTRTFPLIGCGLVLGALLGFGAATPASAQSSGMMPMPDSTMTSTTPTTRTNRSPRRRTTKPRTRRTPMPMSPTGSMPMPNSTMPDRPMRR